jgi:capsular polysaccharide biosynthesis protein
MGTTISQTIGEYFVLALDVIRRRWLAFILPILLVLPVAVIAAKMTPTTYTAKSLILLQPAGRAAGAYSHQGTMDQVAAIEAWLKSDPVMRDLLPEIMDIKDPSDPVQLSALMRVARASINFTLLGGSALEISFESDKPQGLARKLETILGRIMEALTRPDQGIFSASQFALLRREESVQAAKQALYKAIDDAGMKSPEIIEDRLKALHDLEVSAWQYNGEPSAAAGTETAASNLAQQKQDIEDLISDDRQLVGKLLDLYATYQKILADYEPLRERLSSGSNNYVGILDAAASIVVVGRPQDPIFGNSAARKIAIAIMFLSVVGSAGLVWLMELFYPGIRTRSEFEDLSELPVIARFQKLPNAKGV